MSHGIHLLLDKRLKNTARMAIPTSRAVQSVLTSFPCERVSVCVCVLGALMHELEAILHEYLSFNWDRMEEVNTANAPLQRKEGLACPWRPSKDIQHSVSTATYRHIQQITMLRATMQHCMASVWMTCFLELWGGSSSFTVPISGFALSVVASNAFPGTAESIAAFITGHHVNS